MVLLDCRHPLFSRNRHVPLPILRRLIVAVILATADLTIPPTRPGVNAIFPVALVLVSGKHKAILIDT